MSIIIDSLSINDLDRGFLELLSELSEVDLTYEQAKNIFNNKFGPGSYKHNQTFVAIDSDTNNVVGTSSLLIEQKFIHSGGKVGHIEDVVVKQDCRKNGVGKALVKFAIKCAKAAGCYKVILSCNDDNLEFYKKMGFIKHENSMRLNLNVV